MKVKRDSNLLRSAVSTSNILPQVATRHSSRVRLCAPMGSKIGHPQPQKAVSLKAKEFKCDCCYGMWRYPYRCPCGHNYCTACMGKMFKEALKDRDRIPVQCCKKSVDLAWSNKLLTKQDATRYANALKEKTVTNKMYCPARNCSAVIDLDTHPSTSKGQLRCPDCNIWLCGNCKTAHPNMECAQFQALPEDERAPEHFRFLQLAKEKRYHQCAKCKRYIEHAGGCMHMYCRCGHTFVYGVKQN